jgi:hypothetical protein
MDTVHEHTEALSLGVATTPVHPTLWGQEEIKEAESSILAIF